MQVNEPGRQKRAVEQLNFGTKTSKRVTWESWEFTVIGPHQAEVTNASYGFLKEDHSYTVGVENRDGLAVPAECNCPADIHHDSDCKHKVALATVGGPTVLDAAIEFEQTETGSIPNGLKSDGGEVLSEVETENTCLYGESNCDGPNDEDLPCFNCYQHAHQEGQ